MDHEIIPQLTEHELHVLRLVAQELTNKEISCSLDIKVRTVEYHLGEIFRRLSVSSRTAATMKAKKMRLLDV